MFGKKSKRGDVRERTVDPDELRRSVDEGFLIAKSALTVAVTNRIIVRALTEHATFDVDVVAAATREEMNRLASEQSAGAERMRQERAKADKLRGRSKHQHDYRRGDSFKLRQREATYEALATELEQRTGDTAFVDEIVIAARERAWSDIGGSVVDRLGWAARPPADWSEGRDDRLRDLLEIDFAALVAEREGSEDARDEEDAEVEGSDPSDPDA